MKLFLLVLFQNIVGIHLITLSGSFSWRGFLIRDFICLTRIANPRQHCLLRNPQYFGTEPKRMMK
jgi:hypothetical protein